jgi:hypothetical protein
VLEWPAGWTSRVVSSSAAGKESTLWAVKAAAGASGAACDRRADPGHHCLCDPPPVGKERRRARHAWGQAVLPERYVTAPPQEATVQVAR